MGRRKINLDIDRIEQLASRGLSDTAICASLGVGRTTFYARKRESEQFELALSRGRARGEGDVADALWEMIFRKNADGDYAEPPIVRLKAAQFWLERRAGWVAKLAAPEEKDDGRMDIRSDEEIAAMATARQASIEAQKAKFLPERREAVEKLKQEYAKHDSFLPDAEPFTADNEGDLGNEERQ